MISHSTNSFFFVFFYSWCCNSILQGLFRKILNGRIRPSKLVRMSADELASRELAQWREQETKHVRTHQGTLLLRLLRKT